MAVQGTAVFVSPTLALFSSSTGCCLLQNQSRLSFSDPVSSGGRELGAEPDVSGGINTWNHSDSVPIQNRLTERQEESCVDLSSPLFVNRTVQSRMYSLLVVRSKYTRQSSVG